MPKASPEGIASLHEVVASYDDFFEHTEVDGAKMFNAVSRRGLEGIVSKKLNAPYRSGPSKRWTKTKNPKAPAATRVIDGTF